MFAAHSIVYMTETLNTNSRFKQNIVYMAKY